jgi:membrane fusion protein (multidrug efflux system)
MHGRQRFSACNDDYSEIASIAAVNSYYAAITAKKRHSNVVHSALKSVNSVLKRRIILSNFLTSPAINNRTKQRSIGRGFAMSGALLLTLGLTACGGAKPKKADEAPLVVIAPVTTHEMADRIEAVGTAYAQESTTLTSIVTEQIVRLNFADGASVSKGAVIAELRQNQQNANFSAARARMLETQQRLTRLQTLQKQGFATAASVDEQVAARDAARAQAGLAQAQIGDRVIRAPFSGLIGLRRISPGATVQAGTEIATISDISLIKLDFSLPESFLAAMKVGAPIEAHAAAYPDELFKGRIEGIDTVIDPNTRSIMIRAILPNADGRLRPGMLLTVSVITHARNSVAVPEAAIIGEREHNFVYKVDGEMTALKTPVTIGTRQGQLVEITSGLKAGDRFISEGVVKARDGGKVRDAPSTGTKPAASAKPAK